MQVAAFRHVMQYPVQRFVVTRCLQLFEPGVVGLVVSADQSRQPVVVSQCDAGQYDGRGEQGEPIHRAVSLERGMAISSSIAINAPLETGKLMTLITLCGSTSSAWP